MASVILLVYMLSRAMNQSDHMIWDTDTCTLALWKKASETLFNNYRAVLFLQFQSVN